MVSLEEGKDIYFHYCSLDTFMKIIETGKLRICNPYKMNDSKELVWFFDLLSNLIEKYTSNIEDQEMIDSYKYYYNDAIMEVYQNDFLGKEVPHITCFSICGDILSQWRAYADNGKGMAIGFDMGSLLKKPNDFFEFKPVCYDLCIQKEVLYKILEGNGLDDPSKLKFYGMSDLHMEASTLIEEILLESICHKNPAFLEEHEVRLIFYANNYVQSNADDKENNVKVLGPFFRNNGEEIISYYELDFSKVKSEIINSLYIGPKSKVAKFDIELFLKANGYKNYKSVKIEKSAATYR